MPELLPQDMFLWSAFVDLHTCRLYEGGPIPWMMIISYADRYNLNHKQTDELVYFIGTLDRKHQELSKKGK